MAERKRRPRLPIAREGWGYIAGLLFVTLIAGFFGSPGWAALFFLLTCGVLAFFRDPERDVPDEAEAVVSPADGKVVAVDATGDGGSVLRIFLSPLDVHINRFPVAGEISEIQYRKGRFLAAYKESASQINEQNAIDIRSHKGENFRVVQIAGFLARRIVCWVQKGDFLETGERFGLIQFGSRTDLYVPKGYNICVEVGRHVRGGESIVARAIQE